MVQKCCKRNIILMRSNFFIFKWVALVGFLLIGLYGIITVDTDMVPSPVTPKAVTYITDSPGPQRWLSIDVEQGLYYYTEDYNHCYIKGTVELLCNKKFKLSSEKNEKIFPQQNVDLEEETITLTIRDSSVEFVRASYQVELIESEDIYM